MLKLYVSIFQDGVYTLNNHVMRCGSAQTKINEPRNQRLTRIKNQEIRICSCSSHVYT